MDVDMAVGLVAAGFAVMGAVGLAAPTRVLSQFGVAVETAAGRNEVRAVYGGFGIAAAVLLLFAPESFDAGIRAALAALLAGMASARVVSAVVDRALSWPVFVYGLIEVAAAALLFWATGVL